MPPQGGAAQGSGDGNGALWLSALAVITCVIVWYFCHDYIAFGIVKLKAWESYLFNPFTTRFHDLQQQATYITVADAKQYSISDLGNISGAVGAYTRFGVFAIMLLLAAKLYLGSNTLKYRNIYSIQRLITDEQKNWPSITSVVGISLDKVPLDESPWGMSLTPMLYAKKNKLLDIETVAPNNERLSTDIRLIVTLRRAKAKQYFLMQLGSYWHGVEGLPLHAQALFAMFAAKNQGDKEAVTHLNRQIAASAIDNSKHLNFQGLDALLAKYKNSKAVLAICQAHAFNYTVMAAMLEHARADGVYATADFLWLKPIDRRLWYTLNSVGRQTPFTEVAGILSHYASEKRFGRKILTPMVDAAVNALDVALSEVIYRPDVEE